MLARNKEFQFFSAAKGPKSSRFLVPTRIPGALGTGSTGYLYNFSNNGFHLSQLFESLRDIS